MSDKKEATAYISSAATDERRPPNVSANSISNYQLKNKKKFLETISMSELYDNVYPSKPPLIDGLLYTGVYLFAGAPKVGKSFLIAQIAYHISRGEPLWEYFVRKSTVLYLALEDDYSRLQERFYRMFGIEGTNNLFFSVMANTLDGGLIEQLENFIEGHSDTRLIVIDTLQMVRRMGTDNYSYANDYKVITDLKRFAYDYGVCVLLVHHTRKQNADDTFDKISGTTGLLGAADGAFVLQKERRTGNKATFEVSGRDQQEQKVYLVRNTETLLWEFEKAETELWKEPPEPLLDEIAGRVMKDISYWEGSASELVALLETKVQANIITKRLNILSGRLYDEHGIRYKKGRCHEGRKIFLWKDTEKTA